MRIYVAGSMTGLPGLNFDAFHRAAARLRGIGHTVINPAEINADPSAEWAVCMRADIRELVTCDAVALLPGWENSRGASLEHHIATKLGMPCCPAHEIPPAKVPLAELPCWGTRDEDGCTGCTLLQLPQDCAGSFPDMALQAPAGRTIDGQFYCPNRRSAGAVVPGPSVGTELGAVSAVAHAVDCAAADSAATPCNVGAPQAAGYVRQGTEGAAG